MLFNSIAFVVFLPIVFSVYWYLDRFSLKTQNVFVIIASYVFYGWWDYRFLGLIIISTIVDFVVGIALGKTRDPRPRKHLLILSLSVNLGMLGLFKYYGFFVDSLKTALTSIGFDWGLSSLDFVLPVGISFYTFQTLSYSIDVYRKKTSPTSNFVAFAAYVGFFPQLVAGPIERAKRLLPQFLSRRKFDPSIAADGVRQMLWGLAKKVVVADNASILVNHVFDNYRELDAVSITIGVFLFAIQIYCDFSGYSDIAIGCAKLFGFRLMRNFAFPYFSRDISEFWSRWHISLSSWFRDYLYIPLGGGKRGTTRRLFNVMLVFVISGFWHGANWTFVFWGFLHGLFYLPLVVFGLHKRKRTDGAISSVIPRPIEGFQILITFCLVLVSWVFFRAPSIKEAFGILGHAATHLVPSCGYSQYGTALLLSTALLVVEWFSREKQHPLEIGEYPRFVRWAFYYCLIALIILKGNFGHVPFIYFQF